MENQNDRQENKNRGNNNEGGVMDKIGDAIENVVDTVTGNNQDQQKGRNNNR